MMMNISTLKKLLEDHPDFKITLLDYDVKCPEVHNKHWNATAGLAIGIYGPMCMAVKAALKVGLFSNKHVDHILYGTSFAEWNERHGAEYQDYLG